MFLDIGLGQLDELFPLGRCYRLLRSSTFQAPSSAHLHKYEVSLLSSYDVNLTSRAAKVCLQYFVSSLLQIIFGYSLPKCPQLPTISGHIVSMPHGQGQNLCDGLGKPPSALTLLSVPSWNNPCYGRSHSRDKAHRILS